MAVEFQDWQTFLSHRADIMKPQTIRQDSPKDATKFSNTVDSIESTPNNKIRGSSPSGSDKAIDREPASFIKRSESPLKTPIHKREYIASTTLESSPLKKPSPKDKIQALLNQSDVIMFKLTFS